MASLFRSPPRSPAATALGRSFGAMFFSVFGALWLTLALYASGHLTRSIFIVVLAVPMIVIALAVRLLGPAKRALRGHPRSAERQRDDRLFGWINAGQGLAIFVLFFTLPRLGLQEFAVAGAVMVVGVHFLFMPPTYRYRSNDVLGVAMMVWGALCMVVFRGDRMIAPAAFGAGLMLWTQTAWSLHTASSHLRRSGALEA